jgi:hypothetical protein
MLAGGAVYADLVLVGDDFSSSTIDIQTRLRTANSGG